MPAVISVLIAALAGLALGHLSDLLFDRFYTGQPIIAPLYRCRACKSPLQFLDALPIVGFVAHRGRCGACGERLPLRALVLPIGSAVLFVASELALGSLGAGLLGGFFCTLFLTLTLTDIETHLLPNRLVLLGMVVAIAFCWAWPDASALQVLAGGLTSLGVAIFLFLLSLPFGSGALGMGDVKMIVLMGFVTGMPGFLVAIMIGTLAGAIFAAALLVSRRAGRRDYIPHGPFLALGGVIAILFGHDIWHAYTG